MSGRHIARRHSRAGGLGERHEDKGAVWRINSEVDKAISLEVGRVVGSHFDYVLSNSKERSSTRGNSNSNNVFNSDSDNEKCADMEQGEDSDDEEAGYSGTADNREEAAASSAGSNQNGESLEPIDDQAPSADAGPHDVNVNRENDRQYNGRGRGRASGRTGQPNRPAVVDYGLPDDVGGLVDEDEFEFVFDLEPSSDVDPAVLPNTPAGPLPMVLPVRDAPVAGGSALPVAPEVLPVVVPLIPTFDIPLDAPAAPLTNAVRNPVNPARQTLMTSARPELLADLLTDSGESVHDLPQQQPCLKVSDIIYSDYACSAGSSDEAEIPNSQDDDTTAESMATASSSLRHEVKMSLNLKNVDVTPIGLAGDGINVAPPSHAAAADKNRTDSQDDVLNGNDEDNTPSDSPFVSDDANQDDQEMASAEHDFRSLDYVLVREPLNVLGERTEQDADALLEQVINGVRDKGMGPNNYGDSEVVSPDRAYYDREMSRSTERSSNSVSCHNTSTSDDTHDKTEGEVCLSSPQSSSARSDDHLMECDTQANASVQAKDDELLCAMDSMTATSFHDDVGEPFIRIAATVDDVLADSPRTMRSGLEELSGKPVCDREYDWSASRVNITYDDAKNSVTSRKRDLNQGELVHHEILELDRSDPFRDGNDEKNSFETEEKFEKEPNGRDESNNDQISCLESYNGNCQMGGEEISTVLFSLQTESCKRIPHEDVELCAYETNCQTPEQILADKSGEKDCDEVYINQVDDTTPTSPGIDMEPTSKEDHSDGEEKLEEFVSNLILVNGVSSESELIGDKLAGDDALMATDVVTAEYEIMSYDYQEAGVEAGVESDESLDGAFKGNRLMMDQTCAEDLNDISNQKADMIDARVTRSGIISADLNVCNEPSPKRSPDLDREKLTEILFMEDSLECHATPKNAPNEWERKNTTKEISNIENFGITETEEAPQGLVVCDDADCQDYHFIDEPLHGDITGDSPCKVEHLINADSREDPDDEINDRCMENPQVVDERIAVQECAECVKSSPKDKEVHGQELIVSDNEPENAEAEVYVSVTPDQTLAPGDVLCDELNADLMEGRTNDNVICVFDAGGVGDVLLEESKILTEAQSMTRPVDDACVEFPGHKDALITDNNLSDSVKEQQDELNADLQQGQKLYDLEEDLDVIKEQTDSVVILDLDQEREDHVPDFEAGPECEYPCNVDEDVTREDNVNEVEDSFNHNDHVIDEEAVKENDHIIDEEAVKHNDHVIDEEAVKHDELSNDEEVSFRHEDSVNDDEAVKNYNPITDDEVSFKHDDHVDDEEASIKHDVETFAGYENPVNYVERETPMNYVMVSQQHSVPVDDFKSCQERFQSNNDLDITQEDTYDISHADVGQEHDVTVNDLEDDIKIDSEDQDHDCLDKCTFGEREQDEACSFSEVTMGKDLNKAITDNAEVSTLDTVASLQKLKAPELELVEESSTGALEDFCMPCRAGGEGNFGDVGQYNKPYPANEVSRNELELDQDTKQSHDEPEIDLDMKVSCDEPELDQDNIPCDEPDLDQDTKLHGAGLEGQGDCMGFRSTDDVKPTLVQMGKDSENISVDRQEKFIYLENASESVNKGKEQGDIRELCVTPVDYENSDNAINQGVLKSAPEESNFGEKEMVSNEEKVTSGNVDDPDIRGTDHKHESSEFGTSAPDNVDNCLYNSQDFGANIEVNQWDVERRDEERSTASASFKDFIGDIISCDDDRTDSPRDVDDKTKSLTEFDGPTRGLSNSSLELEPPCGAATLDNQKELEDFDDMIANIRVTCEDSTKDQHNEPDSYSELGRDKVRSGSHVSSVAGDFLSNGYLENSFMSQKLEHVRGGEISMSKTWTILTTIDEVTEQNVLGSEDADRLNSEQLAPNDVLDQGQEGDRLHSEEDFNDDEEMLLLHESGFHGAPPQSEETRETTHDEDKGAINAQDQLKLYETSTATPCERDEGGSPQSTCQSDNPETRKIDFTYLVGERNHTDTDKPCGSRSENLDTDKPYDGRSENLDTDKPCDGSLENQDTDSPFGDWFDDVGTETPRVNGFETIISNGSTPEVKVESYIETAVSYYNGVDTNIVTETHESAVSHCGVDPSPAGTKQSSSQEESPLEEGMCIHLGMSGEMSSRSDENLCDLKEGNQEATCEPINVDIKQTPTDNILAAPMPAEPSHGESREQIRPTTDADDPTLAAESRYELDPTAKGILEATDLWLNKISDLCQTPTIEMEEDKLHEIADKCTSELLSLVKSRSEENSQDASASSQSTSKDAINSDLSSSGKSAPLSSGPGEKSSSKPPSVSISRRPGSTSRSTDCAPKSSSGTSSPGILGSKHGASTGSHRPSSTTSSTDIDVTMSRSGTRPNSRADGMLTRESTRSHGISASASGVRNIGSKSDSGASTPAKNKTTATLTKENVHNAFKNKGFLGSSSPRICPHDSVQKVKNSTMSGLRPHSSGNVHDCQKNRPPVARPLSARSGDGKTRELFQGAEGSRKNVKGPLKVAGVLDLTDKAPRQAESTTKTPGGSKSVVHPLTDQYHEPHPPPVGKADSLEPKFKREMKVENGFKRIALRANSGTRMQRDPKVDEQAVQGGPSPRLAGGLNQRRILKSQGTVCDADVIERARGGRPLLFNDLPSSPRTSSFTQTDRLGRQHAPPSGYTGNKTNTSPRGTGDGEGKERRGRVMSVGIGDGTGMEKTLKERDTRSPPEGGSSHRSSRGEAKVTNEIEAVTQLNRQRMEPLKLREHAKKRPKAVKMMTMQEFEKIQAERHLTQAFARIHSSKPCVDCHMDAKVMDKTGMSTKRRRERINYDSLIALENVKFLEMLRFKKSAYDRDEQLKDFKKSYKHMVMVGRHPSGWKETRGVDKMLTKGKHDEGGSQKHDIIGI